MGRNITSQIGGQNLGRSITSQGAQNVGRIIFVGNNVSTGAQHSMAQQTTTGRWALRIRVLCDVREQRLRNTSLQMMKMPSGTTQTATETTVKTAPISSANLRLFCVLSYSNLRNSWLKRLCVEAWRFLGLVSGKVSRRWPWVWTPASCGSCQAW